jgi:hypothetical protein
MDKTVRTFLLLLVGDSGKPRMCTATCWLIVPPALDFKLWPLDAPAPIDAFRTPVAKAGTYGNFAQDADSIVHLGIFYMPQILRHGTHGFTSLPKEGALRFFALKNLMASAGFGPTNLGTRGQHANP